MNEKITNGHLSKDVYIYVRQSTSGQVMNNRESQIVQYKLTDRAQQLGWSKEQVNVIDQDLGVSASGSATRSGFERLMKQVCSATVGAIFSVDASRLARNGREWHSLLEVCGVVGTLLIDHDSIYSPETSNDRLLLGLKGEFSEMELRVLRERSQAAIKEKARRGDLYLMISAGYVKSLDGKLKIDPDKRVQEAIALVFQKFRELGSIQQVQAWFVSSQVDMPVATYRNGVRLKWCPPSVNGLGNLLKNPVYAGAYAYGRTKRETEIKEGRKHVKKGIPLPEDQWQVLIRDHHEAYITWDEYQRNKAIIMQNTNRKRPIVTGSAGQGEAILSGIMRCGHCGSKLTVRYQGNGGRSRVYYCSGRDKNRSSVCISFGGKRVDDAVSNSILEVLSPMGLNAALEALNDIESSQSQIRQQKLLALQQAKYEASRMNRQYSLVDPENRLVAAALEREWNIALIKVDQLEKEIALLDQKVDPITQKDRASILALANELPFVWNHKNSTPEIKKKIIRTVIKEIVVYLEQIEPDRAIIKMKIHWQGGDHTELETEKNRRGERANVMSTETKAMLSALARIMPDAHIAGCLNRLGVKTATGLTWTPARVVSSRQAYHIAVYKQGERQERGELTPDEVSHELGVSVAKVLKLIKRGVLPAKQVCAGMPWIIEKGDLLLERVQSAAKKPLAKGPSHPNQKQSSFEF